MVNVDICKMLKAPKGRMELNIQFSIPKGSFLTLYGKSGAGKTSILRMIAGLMAPNKGEITIDDEYWYSSSNKINLKPQQRNVGFLFQDYALFPNMTVREQLLFARLKGDSPKRIDELIEIIELGDLQHQKPKVLSGGQKQRVALARALVQRPKILMLDEPLSALDQTMRQKLQNHILHIHQEFQLTTILVSHDIPEIVKLSDSILEIANGQIVRYVDTESFVVQEDQQAIQLVGKITQIEKGTSSLQVLIGDELLQLTANINQLNNLIVGDKISITFQGITPSIRKINNTL